MLKMTPEELRLTSKWRRIVNYSFTLLKPRTFESLYLAKACELLIGDYMKIDNQRELDIRVATIDSMGYGKGMHNIEVIDVMDFLEYIRVEYEKREDEINLPHNIDAKADLDKTILDYKQTELKQK